MVDSEYLKRLRHENRVTMRRLSQATGYQIGYLSGIEHGRYEPLPDEKRKIEAAILNPVDIFAGEAEKMRKELSGSHCYTGCAGCAVNIYYFPKEFKKICSGLCSDCLAEKRRGFKIGKKGN